MRSRRDRRSGGNTQRRFAPAPRAGVEKPPQICGTNVAYGSARSYGILLLVASLRETPHAPPPTQPPSRFRTTAPPRPPRASFRTNSSSPKSRGSGGNRRLSIVQQSKQSSSYKTTRLVSQNENHQNFEDQRSSYLSRLFMARRLTGIRPIQCHLRMERQRKNDALVIVWFN